MQVNAEKGSTVDIDDFSVGEGGNGISVSTTAMVRVGIDVLSDCFIGTSGIIYTSGSDLQLVELTIVTLYRKLSSYKLMYVYPYIFLNTSY